MDEVALYDHVSDWSFEQIADWFARWYEPINPGLLSYPNMHIVVDTYHWCLDGEELSYEELMNDKPLYVGDNSLSWNIHRRKGMSLYKVSCALHNPLSLIEQGDYLECMESNIEPKIRRWENVTGRKVDAVIYTPHPYLGEPELRQMKLLYPQESIASISYMGTS